MIQLRTAFFALGLVVLLPAQERAPESGLAELAARLAPGGQRLSSFHALRLAELARARGQTPETWTYFEAALTAPDAAERAEAIDAFARTLEPLVLHERWGKAPPATRVRELLYTLRPPVAAGKARVVEVLLAAEPDADAELRLRARTHMQPAQREAAVRALLRRGGEGNERFVYRTTLLDPARPVRAAAAQATAAAGKAAPAVAYLAPAFADDRPEVRIRTAEALADLGHEAGVEALVAAGPKAGVPAAGGGGSTRGHIAVTTQQAYVRDFDVEVAQSAFIAKPVVDVLEYGTVLDATVVAVFTYRREILASYRAALRRLCGADPGADPSQWVEFLRRWRAERAAAAGPKTQG
ncbi:MAG: hypothetical protein IT458_01955 [Planctomycetes bacterium]|nr:hypothetical protein [Planctomycetota bacterium]